MAKHPPPSGHDRAGLRTARIAAVLVGGLTTLLLTVGVARHVLHHFYYRAPYLQDSGWYSAIVYRAGLFPSNPPIACDYADGYYGVHASPFVSLFSMISYLVPLDRIEWYAVFQAIVFAPLGIATYLLASRIKPVMSLRTLPFTMAAALSFAFSGMVLWLIAYPHYEAAIPGFVCLTLVGIVTNRPKLAWVCLVLAASVREDGGLHAALAITPLLYLNWRGVPVGSRRTLIRMFCVAVAISVIAIVSQKLFFDSANLLRAEYFGRPFYGHLSVSLLLDRARILLEARQVYLYPFVLTVLVAVLRRDARYLLGWAAAMPWFLVNFTAHQELKGAFELYTGFPFIVSVFWVYLYGAALAPTHRRLRPGANEAVFAIVCASSTLGFYRLNPGGVQMVLKDMAFHRTYDRAAVHALATMLQQRRVELGRLYVDQPVASHTLETLGLENSWQPGVQADTIAFHHRTYSGPSAILADLIENKLDACHHVIGTSYYVCAKAPLGPNILGELKTELVPTLFVFASRKGNGFKVDAGRVIITGEAAFRGRLGVLKKGTYELTVETETSVTVQASAELEIRGPKGGDEGFIARVPFGAGSDHVTVRFDADGVQPRAFGVLSKPSAHLILTNARLRRLPDPEPR